MRLKYWVAPCLDDSSAYNRRAKTLQELLRDKDYIQDLADGRFGPPEEVILEYDNAFHLVTSLLSEGGGFGLIINNAENL